MTRVLTMLTAAVLLGGMQLPTADAQEPMSPTDLAGHVAAFKSDPRGPFQGIRWFCPDGTVRAPGEPCPGGNQHALVKDVVGEIARRNGVYLGQVLTGTPYTAFADTAAGFQRAAQYQIERFLQRIDDGWIFRKARYYRGALQAEDEEEWGKGFLEWMLGDDRLLKERFYLVRQMVADVPHRAGDPLLPKIRSLARTLGDSLRTFMDLRVKIHGQPGPEDLESVRVYRTARTEPLSTSTQSLLAQLEQALALAYAPPDFDKLTQLVSDAYEERPLKDRLAALARSESNDPRARPHRLADLLWSIRLAIPQIQTGAARLRLLDLSLEIEAQLFRSARAWEATTVRDALEKARVLALGAAGAGFFEQWEWDSLDRMLLRPGGFRPIMQTQDYVDQAAILRRAVGWGTGTVRAAYGSTVERFAAFEPLANGFIDDRVRGSVLLPFGEAVSRVAQDALRRSGTTHHVEGLPNAGGLVGLNPGFAVGTLHVVEGTVSADDMKADGIYLVERPPEDLKPVAGIATVSEGNMVSHVQLLARNLGIPNAGLPLADLQAITPLNGTRVFYAVSPGGRVVLKPATQMTAAERSLVEEKQRLNERVRVSTKRLDLTASLPSLLDLRASDSGRLCGPKAANLGQLRSLFPERVAPGFVIPFGVFKNHMDQLMVGEEVSYWKFLRETFELAADAKEDGKGDEAIEREILARLETLRRAIAAMPFRDGFVASIERRFQEVFDTPLGRTAVFVRSDTNMEDLADFTGAGLNLTVANVRDRDPILKAIRDVWASPFTERSYRWRQRFLLNPHDVYPSILLLKSVPAEVSGVVITTGLVSQDSRDVTVAFNRGVGGAVEGQAAETYLLKAVGDDVLLSPSREPLYTVLPLAGGTRKVRASFETPLLTWSRRSALRRLSGELKGRLPFVQSIGSKGPYDIEMGFLDGEPWLFQVRPFVENKRARSSSYLRSMVPEPDRDAVVRLDSPMEAQ